MMRRARSVSRLRGTTPARDGNPSIYEYGSANDGTGGNGYSTRLNVYAPDVYGAVSRLTRAVSVARSKDVDEELLNINNFRSDRLRREQSVGRLDHLRARRPYSAYGTHDFDYFDRYTERIRDKTPIALDSHYTHYRPYYWYHTAPRTFYYNFPYDDWRYRPLNSYRSPSLYSASSNDSSYNYRFNDSIDRVGSLKRAMRDLDYSRELRQLRYATPSTYSTISYGDSLLGQARDEVRRVVDSRVSGSSLSRLSNTRDYFGRAYAQLEDEDLTDVGVKYTGLGRTIDGKSSRWKVEDTLDTAYDLQAMNEDTIDKLEQNQKQIKKNQQTLIQGESGVAPRLCFFDLTSRKVHRDVGNTLQFIRDIKQMKDETFKRLSQPWTFGSYLRPE